jgi:purine-binding chemotaxis protein CheW
MTDNNMPTDLQALWEELTQSDDARRKRIRQRRFDERAKQYAQIPIVEETYAEDEVYKVLTFHSGDERYGIDVDVVTGVRPAEKITRVPAVPNFYRGVINVRGQIISVLDLRLFFGLSASDSENAELILLQADNLSLALLTDRVEEVQWIPRNTVETVDMRYARGVTANRLVILDTDYLLSDDRLIIGGETLI